MGELFETETNIPNHGVKKNFQTAVAATCLIAGFDCSKLTSEEVDSLTVKQIANNLLDENYRRLQVVKKVFGMDIKSRIARQEMRLDTTPPEWGVFGRVITYLSTLSSDTCTQKPSQDIAQASEPSSMLYFLVKLS